MSSKETRFLAYDQINGRPIPMPFPITPDILKDTFKKDFVLDWPQCHSVLRRAILFDKVIVIRQLGKIMIYKSTQLFKLSL